MNTCVMISEFELGRDKPCCLSCLNVNELQILSLKMTFNQPASACTECSVTSEVLTEEAQFLCRWFCSSNFCDFFFPDDHEQHTEL